MDDVYLEQVKSFGDVQRHPAARVVTVAYCSLINIQQHRLQKADNELHWHKLSADMNMAFDHQQILDVCHEWLQKRVQEHPLGIQSAAAKIFPARIAKPLRSDPWYSSWTGAISGRNSFPWTCLKTPTNWNLMFPTDRANSTNSIIMKYKTKEGRKFMRLDF